MQILAGTTKSSALPSPALPGVRVTLTTLAAALALAVLDGFVGYIGTLAIAQVAPFGTPDARAVGLIMGTLAFGLGVLGDPIATLSRILRELGL